jgi:glycosyltransferase involved in cell wall biosynthesis
MHKVIFRYGNKDEMIMDVEGDLRFSIITPSYNSSQWLPLCVASIADQEAVEVEHIVQDSCSTDGTHQLLKNDSRIKLYIEKDQGMYDAVNRGFDRATGDILAYLNCDEQYLPGALKAVRDCFSQDPRLDVLLSDTIVTDPRGNYICHRYSLVPRKHQLWVRFPVLTCSCFIRRGVVKDLGIRFDSRWRDLGDFFWIQEMIRRGLRFRVLPRFTSVFTDTGENMNLRPNALRERATKWQMAPGWVKLMKYPFAFLYRLRLAGRGFLFQKPFHFSIYTLGNSMDRLERHAPAPTSFWKGRSRQQPLPTAASNSTLDVV